MTETNVYGLKLSTRCLRPVVASTTETKFLVGTNELNAKNELHLVHFDDITRKISSKKFKHSDPIQYLDSCPMDNRLVLTCHSTLKNEKLIQGVSLFKLPDLDTFSKDSTQSEGLENLFTIHEEGESILKVDWNPSAKELSYIQLNQNNLKLVKIDNGMKDTQELVKLNPFGEGKKLYNCQWKPNSDQVVVVSEQDVKGVDLNSKATTFHIQNAHKYKVRDIDCNPNINYQLMTGGDDGLVKFWDIRNAKTPIKELNNHSHWVWSVGYNRLHDQLVLSGGSDCQVNLNNIVSISSAQSLMQEDSDTNSLEDVNDLSLQDFQILQKPKDRLINSYDYHEDSVYSTSWSSANPWVFASLSYDGRLVFNLVPQDEKYKILL